MTQDDRSNLTEEQEAYFVELGWYMRGDEPEGRRLSQEDQRLKRAADDDRGTGLREG
jgi:hypothetical protein